MSDSDMTSDDAITDGSVHRPAGASIPSIGMWISELKQRCVTRAVTTYTLSFWLIVQLGDVGFPLLEVPDWVLEDIVIVGLVGFPVVLLASWLLSRKPAPGGERGRAKDLLSTTVSVSVLIAAVALVGLIAFQML